MGEGFNVDGFVDCCCCGSTTAAWGRAGGSWWGNSCFLATPTSTLKDLGKEDDFFGVDTGSKVDKDEGVVTCAETAGTGFFSGKMFPLNGSLTAAGAAVLSRGSSD